MSTINRRAVLAGTAVLPASPLPTPAAAFEECSYPALARRLDALYDRWLAQTQKDWKNSEQFDRQLFALTGLRPRECPIPIDMDANFRRLWDQAHNGIDYGPYDEDGHPIVWNEIHDEMSALCDEIVHRPATTLADLALQARAIALNNNAFWLGDEEDHYGITDLVNNVCRLAGVEAMPRLES